MNKKPQIYGELERLSIFAPIPFYWTNEKGVIVGLNRFAFDLAQNLSYKNLIGKSAFDLYTPETAIVVDQNIKQVMKTRQTLVFEEELVDLNGLMTRYYISARSPLFEEDKVIGIVACITEITAQKEAERQNIETQKQKLEQEKNFRRIAAQVAHDISSPLASMQMILPHCDSLPENTRNALNKSAIRIADIAENFLSQFKPKEEDEVTEISRYTTLISAEILEVLTEKKYEYSKLSVDFTYDISQSGYFAFIYIDVRAFKRMLSNLINNAVDALDGRDGEIKISLDVIESEVKITITDNGKGIPQDVIDKIMNAVEVTTGKKSGHGIGFSQVRDTLANNDGRLNIESTVGVGTKITVIFPKIEAPRWIAKQIELNDADLVVILDDDESIHDAWDMRFEKAVPNIRRRHFKHGDEAIDFINNLNSIEKEKVFLLTDYELLRQNLNGLDVVAETQVKRSILVTSHHNNKELRDSMLLSQTEILPKALASVIPISVSNQGSVLTYAQLKIVDMVFVDDDVNLLDVIMEFVVKDSNKVDRYHRVSDFLKNVSQYAKDTKFLLDNQYKHESISGLELAVKLHDLGYTKLYLFSSECFDESTSIPKYLKIIAKDDLNTVKKLLNS